MESLHAKFSKPRSERSTVANLGKALRRPSANVSFDALEEDPTSNAA